MTADFKNYGGLDNLYVLDSLTRGKIEVEREKKGVLGFGKKTVIKITGDDKAIIKIRAKHLDKILKSDLKEATSSKNSGALITLGHIAGRLLEQEKKLKDSGGNQDKRIKLYDKIKSASAFKRAQPTGIKSQDEIKIEKKGLLKLKSNLAPEGRKPIKKKESKSEVIKTAEHPTKTQKLRIAKSRVLKASPSTTTESDHVS